MSLDIAGWRAEVALRVGHSSLGPYQLPLDEAVTLGRSELCGLRLDHPAISRHLATFVPSEHGWTLVNGKRTRVRAESVFVVDACFTPGARVLLQPADWVLTWDLDVLSEVTVKYRRERRGNGLPIARDTPVSEAALDNAPHLVGTDLAGDRLNLTDLQRRRLGALFAYLINEEPKPDQLIQAAAKLSGDSVSQINGTWVRVMEYVNRHRDVPIEHIEDLGYHLVVVAEVIGPEDVPPDPPG